jgi:uncharacterized protein
VSRMILLALTAVLAVSPAAAASFDCKKAKLPAEVAICGDPTLSSEDEALASEYSPLVKSAWPDDAKKIKAEQKAWLAERNACGSDKQCIMGSYRERLEKFGEWRAEIASAPRGAAGEPADANAPTIDPNAPTIGPGAPAQTAPEGDPTGDPD